MPSNMKSFIIRHEFSNYDRSTGERPPGGMELAAEFSLFGGFSSTRKAVESQNTFQHAKMYLKALGVSCFY